MRHEVASLAVPYRLANPRRIGCNDGCRARRGLEIGDPPSLFRGRKDQSPRATQQGQLFTLRDTPKKPHPVAEVKRVRERLETRAIVPCPGDLERRVAMLHRREGTDHVVHTLVLLETSEIGECGARVAGRGSRRITASVDS